MHAHSGDRARRPRTVMPISLQAACSLADVALRGFLRKADQNSQPPREAGPGRCSRLPWSLRQGQGPGREVEGGSHVCTGDLRAHTRLRQLPHAACPCEQHGRFSVTTHQM
jgi:hypothetical protein